MGDFSPQFDLDSAVRNCEALTSSLHSPGSPTFARFNQQGGAPNHDDGSSPVLLINRGTTSTSEGGEFRFDDDDELDVHSPQVTHNGGYHGTTTTGDNPPLMSNNGVCGDSSSNFLSATGTTARPGGALSSSEQSSSLMTLDMDTSASRTEDHVHQSSDQQQYQQQPALSIQEPSFYRPPQGQTATAVGGASSSPSLVRFDGVQFEHALEHRQTSRGFGSALGFHGGGSQISDASPIRSALGMSAYDRLTPMSLGDLSEMSVPRLPNVAREETVGEATGGTFDILSSTHHSRVTGRVMRDGEAYFEASPMAAKKSPKQPPHIAARHQYLIEHPVSISLEDFGPWIGLPLAVLCALESLTLQLCDRHLSTTINSITGWGTSGVIALGVASGLPTDMLSQVLAEHQSLIFPSGRKTFTPPRDAPPSLARIMQIVMQGTGFVVADSNASALLNQATVTRTPPPPHNHQQGDESSRVDSSRVVHQPPKLARHRRMCDRAIQDDAVAARCFVVLPPGVRPQDDFDPLYGSGSHLGGTFGVDDLLKESSSLVNGFSTGPQKAQTQTAQNGWSLLDDQSGMEAWRAALLAVGYRPGLTGKQLQGQYEDDDDFQLPSCNGWGLPPAQDLNDISAQILRSTVQHNEFRVGAAAGEELSGVGGEGEKRAGKENANGILVSISHIPSSQRRSSVTSPGPTTASSTQQQQQQQLYHVHASWTNPETKQHLRIVIETPREAYMAGAGTFSAVQGLKEDLKTRQSQQQAWLHSALELLRPFFMDLLGGSEN